MADGPLTAACASADNGGEGAVEALVNLGVAPEAAAAYVRRGDPEGAVFDRVLLSGRKQRTVSPAEIEAHGGLAVGEVAGLMEAFGLPHPRAADPVFTPEEARVLVALRELDELWPADLRMQTARVYGAMLAGIARAEAQAFQIYTERHVREQDGDTAAHLSALQSAFERLLPLADPLLLGVHRRWLEHELAQHAISAAERTAGSAGLPGKVEVTFLFCDLKDFTAYAERHGDAAAISAIDRFFEVVGHERGPGGQLVKTLGDGAMLVYDEPADAVAAGRRVIAAMRAPGLPGVHASVHRGIAIARSGDYFGGAVNLAARLLALARRDELLATADVVRRCGGAFDWKPAGERTLRGVSTAVAVYTIVSDKAIASIPARLSADRK
ncbi:MAG: adenylate/guanylate cyclase domain-containing protein [Solirubrobacteraceae bacterium]